MGIHNSSVCVVRPTFNEILKSNKLKQFLEFVLPPEIVTDEIPEPVMWYDGHNNGEKVLQPNSAFLEWCRQHTSELKNPELAIMRLRSNPKYKFEGGTHPDIYITTKNCHLVIEAKWTEPHITTRTVWRKTGDRDQLIRHMDSIIGIDSRPVFGLFLISANGKIAKEDIESRFSNDSYIKKSVPHRVQDGTWRLIKSGFRGVLTWQELRNRLSLHEPMCIA